MNLIGIPARALHWFKQATSGRPELVDLANRMWVHSSLSVQPAVWTEGTHTCPGLCPLSRLVWTYCLIRALTVTTKQDISFPVSLLLWMPSLCQVM
jgi:hypothetical protein